MFMVNREADLCWRLDYILAKNLENVLTDGRQMMRKINKQVLSTLSVFRLKKKDRQQQKEETYTSLLLLSVFLL